MFRRQMSQHWDNQARLPAVTRADPSPLRWRFGKISLVEEAGLRRQAVAAPAAGWGQLVPTTHFLPRFHLSCTPVRLAAG